MGVTVCPACGQGQGCTGQGLCPFGGADSLGGKCTQGNGVWGSGAWPGGELRGGGEGRVKAAEEGCGPLEGWEIREIGLKVRACGRGRGGQERGVHIRRILECES